MSPEVHPSDLDSEPVPGVPRDAGAGPLKHDAVVDHDTAALIDDESAGPSATGPLAPTRTPGPGSGSGPGTGPGTEGSLEAVRRERDEYLDMVRRVQADFENYKKRMQRQQTDQLERASENLVAKLLPALDALDLARAHLSDEDNESASVKALLQATALVTDALAKDGLDRIDEPGAPFDPTVHDAVEHAPADDPAPDVAGATAVVADVLRAGYRWKGRVIRPAMVRVRG